MTQEADAIYEAARFISRDRRPPSWLLRLLATYAKTICKLREGAEARSKREDLRKRLDYVEADARRLCDLLANAEIVEHLVNAKPPVGTESARIWESLIPSFDSSDTSLSDMLKEVADRAVIARDALRGGGASRAVPMLAGRPRGGRAMPPKELTALVIMELCLCIHGKKPATEAKSAAASYPQDAADALWRASGGEDDGKTWRHAFTRVSDIPCPELAGGPTSRRNRTAWRRHVREAVQHAARS